MGSDAVFWLLVMLAAINAVLAWRRHVRQRGWLAVYATILSIAIAGQFGGDGRLVWGAGGAWLLLVVVPALLARGAMNLSAREKHAAARRIASVAGMLHPFDGWREAPTFLGAQALASAGDPDGAAALLEPLCRPGSPMGEKASLVRARVLGHWQEIVDLAASHSDRPPADPDVLGLLVRALGETGDAAGMVDLWDRHRDKLVRQPAIRNVARLALFAFSGRVEATRRHLQTALPAMPAPTRDFWLATARLAAGDADAARGEFERILPTANAATRRAIERRLDGLRRPPPSLDPRQMEVVAAEEARAEEESRFAPPVSVWSPGGLVTRFLVGTNVAVFLLETALGGSTDYATLHRLGGLCTGCVVRGAWWRMVTSTFLHLGPLHLAMNVLALAALGPAAETALGKRRFLTVYLVSGIGSMAAVALRAWATDTASFTIGASGAVMGIVGSNAAMMLRGWVRERAPVARQRGLAMAGYVAVQMVVDSMVPQFSFTAHLAGAIIGFVTTLLLGDRLRR